VAQIYYKKQKIVYLPNNNSEHFDVWSRSMANADQRNKQNFTYRNGCAKEISKKIKDRKNKTTVELHISRRWLSGSTCSFG
jgi:hypothetical protein